MSKISRRGFLANSAAVAALTGCGIKSPSHDVSRNANLSDDYCDTRDPNGSIRIDMHCHFLNLRDLSAGPFLARRFFNYDETSLPGLDAVVGFTAGTLAEVLKYTTVSTNNEHQLLKDMQLLETESKPTFQEPKDFCDFADEYQKGIFKATKRNQLTGVFSNKSRNAARIAEVYPSVDIFMPSVVDLYDDRRSMKSIPDQINFYERLNLVTGGRYLPVVSFNPQRQYQVEKAEKNVGLPTYLQQVKDAILHRGFVGVKVHPSSGFSPMDNLTYGCTNTATQIVTENDQELFDRFTAYNELMFELFDFCAAVDVPVITHGSTGLTANRRCMRGPRNANGTDRPAGPFQDANNENEWGYPFRRWGRFGGEDSHQPLEWTNSPAIWDKIAKEHRVKVCISHFANSLDENETSSSDPIIEPSAWLTEAVQVAEKNPYVYIDVSIITEFFGKDENGIYQLRPGYLSAFKALNDQHKKLRKKLIYGTDWHMPRAAKTGAEFLPLIERLLDESGLSAEKSAIMGTRAAEVFGLGSRAQTRSRLETFYKRRGQDFLGRPLTANDIDWMTKMG